MTRHRASTLVIVALAVGGCTGLSPTSGPTSEGSASAGPSQSPHVPSSASATSAATPAPRWTATGKMLTARNEHTATLLPDGAVLVVGGLSGGDATSALPSAELYDPVRGSWTTGGSLVDARWKHTATLLLDGSVLVAGGAPAQSRSAELYDPVGRSWTSVGTMTEARWGHTATLLPDGTVLVAGDGSSELYDPDRKSWTATGAMLARRTGHTATLLHDGTVLVAGGCCGSAGIGGSSELASAELFDPRTGSWTATGAMGGARAEHTATLLLDGMVLVAAGVIITGGLAPDPFASGELVGGYEATSLASAELYDPGNGRWSATGELTDERWPATATLLPDGTVLVAGDGNGPRSDAELYRSGHWTSTWPMIQNRSAHTATLLLTGLVLVSGGSNNASGTILASAELYDAGGP